MRDVFLDNDYTYEIKVKVTKQTYLRWKDLRHKIHKLTGFNNPSKTIEFAIIEALNIPDECLK